MHVSKSAKPTLQVVVSHIIMRNAMKFTLKTAAIAVIAMTILAGTVPVAAQKMPSGQNIEQRLEKMKKHLNLTDDQTAKIKTILETAKTEAAQERNASTSTDKEARRKAMMDLRQKTQEKIKAVLTPEQQQLAEKEMAKHRH